MTTDKPKRGRPRKMTKKVRTTEVCGDDINREELTPEVIKKSADDAGILPHEWLCCVMRGEKITQMRQVITYWQEGEHKGKEKSREWVPEELYPDFAVRLDAAKACAQYYAPKLLGRPTEETLDDVAKLFAVLGKKLPD